MTFAGCGAIRSLHFFSALFRAPGPSGPVPPGLITFEMTEKQTALYNKAGNRSEGIRRGIGKKWERKKQLQKRNF
jgi:hypothetical protein